jgi:hypothetical protein
LLCLSTPPRTLLASDAWEPDLRGVFLAALRELSPRPLRRPLASDAWEPDLRGVFLAALRELDRRELDPRRC